MALNYEKIMAYRPADIRASYGARDCMLYALGIGLGMDPLDQGQLKFVYEKNLAAFPTLATTLGWMGRLTDPAFGIDERMVVLADQRVVLHRPLPPEATLISRPYVKEIIDKGEGNAAIIQITRDLTLEDGTLVATVEGSTLARKHGGFGGKVTQSPVPPAIPRSRSRRNLRSADAAQSGADFPADGRHQSAAHRSGARQGRRLSAADPARHGGLRRRRARHPAHAAGYQPEQLASIEARFVRPIFPGETVRTEMWQNGSDVAFRCRTVERGEVAIDNGLARLR